MREESSKEQIWKLIDREQELVGKIARKSDTMRDMEKKESVEESDGGRRQREDWGEGERGGESDR